MLTPPYQMKAEPPQKAQVGLFVATMVYYLLYKKVVDQKHPRVRAFCEYIQMILDCSSNNVTPCVLFTSLLYVARFSTGAQSQGIQLAGSEVQIWFSALMLADVFLNDAAYAVKSWAEVGHVSLARCIAMKRSFLGMIKYTLHVSPQEYENWVSKLAEISAHITKVTAVNNSSSMIDQNVYPSLLRQAQSLPFTMSCPDYILNSSAAASFGGRRPSLEAYDSRESLDYSMSSGYSPVPSGLANGNVPIDPFEEQSFSQLSDYNMQPMNNYYGNVLPQNGFNDYGVQSASYNMAPQTLSYAQPTALPPVNHHFQQRMAQNAQNPYQTKEYQRSRMQNVQNFQDYSNQPVHDPSNPTFQSNFNIPQGMALQHPFVVPLRQESRVIPSMIQQLPTPPGNYVKGYPNYAL